jgi:hypothetical protein
MPSLSLSPETSPFENVTDHTVRLAVLVCAPIKTGAVFRSRDGQRHLYGVHSRLRSGLEV